MTKEDFKKELIKQFEKDEAFQLNALVFGLCNLLEEKGILKKEELENFKKEYTEKYADNELKDIKDGELTTSSFLEMLVKGLN